MRKCVIFVMSFLLTFSAFASLGPVNTAYAKTLSELQAEQKELKQKQEEAKKGIQNAKSNQELVANEILALDSELTIATNELEIVEMQLEESQQRLQDSEQKLEEATQAREHQFEAFSDRIQYIHENGSIGYLKVLIESKSFNDFLTRLQYINDIMKYDQETLDRLRKFEEVIEVQTAAIEKETKEIEILVEDQRVKNAALEVKKSEKAQLYAKYEKDEAEYQALLDSTEEASQEVTRLINQALATTSSSGRAGYFTVYYTGGQMEWPVPGWYTVSSGYVGRNRPIGSGTEFHTGLDIPASYGTSVVAGEAGTVITSSYVNGYGYTIIINHGGGVTTLYGHNSSLVAKVGDVVSRGQTIAKVGSTGNSTGNHCHFEVRINGQHVNPGPYVGI